MTHATGGIHYRAMTLDDVPELTRITNAATLDDGAHDLHSEESLAHELRAWRWDMAADSLVAQSPDGTLAGWCAVPPPPAGGDHQNGFGMVHPQLRGRGIGRHLLGWQIDRARQQHRAAQVGQPWELHIGSVDANSRATRLFARFGLTPVRYWYEMERDTAGPVLESPVAAGLRIVTFDDSYADRLYLAHMAAFADHWGFQWRSREEWGERLSSRNFQPKLSFLAVGNDANDANDANDGEVAGYLLSVAFEDPSRMTMGTIGTRRAWRRRGIASALMATALAAYREAGVGTATLGVDSANPTGAVRVYERMGFRSVLSATTYSLSIG